MQRRFVALLSLVFAAGCVPLPHQESPSVSNPKAPPTYPLRIAVLPVSNQAGDKDGSIILRAFIIRKLEKDLGYLVQKPEDTDQIIHDRTLTGPEIPVQVAIARQDASVLASWLGVDGLLESQLQAFNRAKLSLYVRSQVKARFWLLGPDGKRLWDVTKDSDNGTLSLGGGGSSVESALLNSGIPSDVMDRVRVSPLGAATLELVDDAFSTLPKH